MKKVTLITFVLLLGVAVFAQEKENSFLSKKNEVKVNLPLSIFASFPEVSYERVLQEDISVGASLGFSLDGGDTWVKMQFSPYFRWFFGGSMESARKYAGGFFIEANSAVYSFKEFDYDAPPLMGVPHDTKKKTVIGTGLGLAIGWKYISKNNWCGEILLGGGKNFAKEGGGYPRFGISIGKRF